MELNKEASLLKMFLSSDGGGRTEPVDHEEPTAIHASRTMKSHVEEQTLKCLSWCKLTWSDIVQGGSSYPLAPVLTLHLSETEAWQPLLSYFRA